MANYKNRYDENYRYKGFTDEDGRHYDENYQYKGFTDEDGRHYDENYQYKGFTDEDGRHYDENYQYKGFTDEDGRHYDENYQYKGFTDEDGRHYDENYQYKGYSDKVNNSSGGCYLTTACVEFRGLEDNCKQLTILRSFRDSFMKENMPGEIDKYYEIAPKIVEKINNLDQDKKNHYYDYIFEVVTKCCDLIQNNHLEEAYNQYKTMVVVLSEI